MMAYAKQIFGTWVFANSTRPLSVHDTRGTILSVQRAQILSPEMNVELMGGYEVFGRQVDGIISQPHPGYPTEGPENISHLGTLGNRPGRSPGIRTARRCQEGLAKRLVNTITSKASLLCAPNLREPSLGAP